MVDIRTDVDNLVKLVKEKKSVSLLDAARYLKVSPQTVQELAEFLEDEGIVDIEYRLTKQFIVDKGVTSQKKVPIMPQVKIPVKPIAGKEKAPEKLSYKDKIKAGLLEINSDEKTIRRLKSHFEEILRQHAKIEYELKKLAVEHDGIKNEINTLLRKITVFSLISNNQNADKAKKEIQMQFDKIRIKKKHFEDELSKFKEFMKF